MNREERNDAAGGETEPAIWAVAGAEEGDKPRAAIRTEQGDTVFILKRKRKQKGKDKPEEPQEAAEPVPVPKSLHEVRKFLEREAGLDKSFDVIFREMKFGGRDTGLYVLNGFAKDEVLTLILNRLSLLGPDELEPMALRSFLREYIPHIQVKVATDMRMVINEVLVGASALFVDHEDRALVIDTKQYPMRTTEEPDLERVVRGSRDGFVETLLTNITLVRRRLRDPKLTYEVMEAGLRTKTSICVGYIEDIADPDLVRSIKQKIAEVKLDGLPLAEKQLEEALIGKGWNPFPLVRYSERPDVVCAHLLEGHIIVFVDTSPSVMMLPSTFFHHLQHAEEYRQTPFIGSYIRWVRYIGILASLFALPLWYLIVSTGNKPPGLEFLGPEKLGAIPLVIQFALVEIGIDLMRLAAVHTPTPLATAMGLIAAILIGDIAVKAGLFNNEIILVMSVAAIGMFATPSYELSLANRIVRLSLLIACGIFGVAGFIIGSTLWLMLLIASKSYASPYMWPFIPFNAMAVFDLIVRRPVLSAKRRMSLTKPIDRTRQPT
ncbi:spore germination protein [Paenibacillus thermoaerophilus]|uniref:Spore germination protein n=1 Tax=Paenibacillus thermoaerophilus TaxID=1215385 RepID=A0ABW2V761_9BACL|nr:spore germination protein [Paenibacillus thermoaerophilus]TMV12037.1 spore germination protein [Paenibacillus thermoaerophilus]